MNGIQEDIRYLKARVVEFTDDIAKLEEQTALLAETCRSTTLILKTSIIALSLFMAFAGAALFAAAN